MLKGKFRWNLRRVIFIGGFILLFLLWGGIQMINLFESNTVYTFEEGPYGKHNAMNTTAISEQYPEIETFVQAYFDQIQSGNYDELVQTFWSASVDADIQSTCSNPIEDTGETVQQLWDACGQLNGVTVNLISVQEIANSAHEKTYQVVIQIIDEDGEIVGRDLYPESVQGHQLFIYQDNQKLKTNIWKFY